MYSRSLHIKIFSPDLQLETLLKSVDLPTEFCFQIETCTDFTEGEPCCEDIVFVDVPCKPPLSDFRTVGGILVACVDSDQVEAVGDDLMFADEVWEKPYRSRLFSLRFRKLLEMAQSRWRSRVNEICLDTLIECMPDMVWFKDIAGSHVKVNDVFARLWENRKKSSRAETTVLSGIYQKKNSKRANLSAKKQTNLSCVNGKNVLPLKK